MNVFRVCYQDIPRNILIAISKLFGASARYLSKFTLYEMIRTSHNFEDVEAALNERLNWSIELASISPPLFDAPLQFRSCFMIRLTNGGHIVTLCSLLFLGFAENMCMHYGRLTPTELKERVDEMGHTAFAVLFAMLDLGVVVVRVAGIFALADTPALATSLVFITMLPSIVPLLKYPVNILKSRMGRAPRGATEINVESGVVVAEPGD